MLQAVAYIHVASVCNWSCMYSIIVIGFVITSIQSHSLHTFKFLTNLASSLCFWSILCCLSITTVVWLWCYLVHCRRSGHCLSSLLTPHPAVQVQLLVLVTLPARSSLLATAAAVVLLAAIVPPALSPAETAAAAAAAARRPKIGT